MKSLAEVFGINNPTNSKVEIKYSLNTDANAKDIMSAILEGKQPEGLIKATPYVVENSVLEPDSGFAEQSGDKIKRDSPKELISESNSPYRYNILRNAVKNDLAAEQGVSLNNINEQELTDKTEEILSKKEKQLYKIPITSLPYNRQSKDSTGKTLASWNPNNNSISINAIAQQYLDVPEEHKKIGNQLFKNVVMHELRHSYDKGGEYLTNYEKKAIFDKRKKDISRDDDQERLNYLNTPEEITARLQEIRSSLKSEGVYDASKDKATIENIKGAQFSRAYKDLLEIMKPQDIADLLNTIAANNPKKGNPVAKNNDNIIKANTKTFNA